MSTIGSDSQGRLQPLGLRLCDPLHLCGDGEDPKSEVSIKRLNTKWETGNVRMNIMGMNMMGEES